MISAFYHRPFPVIDIDENYYLRKQSIHDADDFYKYYSDPEVGQYILAHKPNNLLEAQGEIQYCSQLFANRQGISWALADKKTDKMIGAVGLYINNQHYRAELCYELSRPLWRQGIMTRCLKKLIPFCYDHIGLIRIEASILKVNAASIGLLEQFGFQREATLRNYRYFEQKFYDIELYAHTTDSASHPATQDLDALLAAVEA